MIKEEKDESVYSKRTTAKTKRIVKSTASKMAARKTEENSVAIENNDFKKEKKPNVNSSKDFQSVREAIEKKINDFFEANKDSGLRKLISASKLMEAGVHIGMPTKF
jgi:hypothetical protein